MRGKTMLSVSWIFSLFTFTALAQGLGPNSTNANDPCALITETETTQTLSNGTHIVFKSYSRFYRDSLGRTRTEIFPDQSPQVGAPQEPIEIVIVDPVEGVHYSLNPRNHTGMRYKIELPTLVPSESLPTSFVDAAPAPPPDSPQLMTQGTTEDLGMQMIEGVLARGTRITTTFPVNAVGNDQPIVTLSEQWYSEELKMNVLTKESDPRTGETTERVTVDTSEPDPTLFRPPADYAMIEIYR